MAGAGYKLFNTGDVLTAAQVNTYLQEQVVMVFNDATARTTALSGVLSEGMITYLKDTNAVEKYDGSAWVALVAGDIEGVTASSPLTGGGTSGTVTIGIQDGTTAQKGAVQLENSTSSTSTTTAAVPASVKSAYDLANGAIAKSVVDAKGDLIVGTADDTVSRLAVGATNGHVLTVDSAEATGMKWAAAGGASSFVGASVYSDTLQSIANATNTAVTWNLEEFDTDAFHSTTSNTSRFTIPSGKAGKYRISGFHTWDGDNGLRCQGIIYKNGAITAYVTAGPMTKSPQQVYQIVMDLVVADYVEIFARQDSGGSIDLTKTSTQSKFQIEYLGA